MNASVRRLRAAGRPLKAILRKVNLIRGAKRCYVCGNTFGKFLPFRDGLRSSSPFTRALSVVGSDVVNFACPYCGSTDRLRHIFMYFDRLDFWRRFAGAAILHIAAEPGLSARIEKHGPRLYILGDLGPRPGAQRFDVTAIPYRDKCFDMVICNHVLEHVTNDLAALAEFHRVLRPGGYALLQTPYSSLLANTFVDPAIDTDELRSRFYGQEDHVRLYGRDLFSRIEQSGFRLSTETHAACLAGIDSSYYGVNPAEDLILAIRM
jgi:SAM-dependent methyltransferase